MCFESGWINNVQINHQISAVAPSLALCVFQQFSEFVAYLNMLAVELV